MAITDVDNTSVADPAGDSTVVAIGSVPAALRRAWHKAGKVWIHCSGRFDLFTWLETHPDETPQIWFCAARPGEFAQSDIDLILDRWPLLTLIYVADAWCEGELRSGWPLKGVPRRLLAEVIDEVTLELRPSAAVPAWQPRTVQNFEPWLAVESPGPRGHATRVLVRSLWRDSWLAIQDCLSADGHDMRWWQPPARRPSGPCETLIVDFGFGLEGQPLDGLEGIADEFDRCVALLGFPRHQDVAELSRLGFGHVIGKPFRTETLSTIVMGRGA